MSPLPQQQETEVILTAIDLEKACSCQLATNTAQDSAAAAVKVDKRAVAIMWALIALILLLFTISYFTIEQSENFLS